MVTPLFVLQLIAFVVGYVNQSFQLTIVTFGGVSALTVLVRCPECECESEAVLIRFYVLYLQLCVPNWPWFNRNKLTFLPAKKGEAKVE